MAMCFALMFGRLGSVTGSSLTAILLDKYCQGAFYTAAISLIGRSKLTPYENSRSYFLAFLLLSDSENTANIIFILSLPFSLF